MMSKGWKTLRGDEWQYEDGLCKIEAYYCMSPPNSCLVTIQLKNLQPSEVQIHELLWSIQQKFVDMKIEVFDDRFLTPILKSLQRKGLLAMNLDNSINHRYIKGIHVSQPSKFTDAVGKKRWWRFWS